MVCTIVTQAPIDMRRRAREEKVDFVDEVEINSRSYYGRDASRQLIQPDHDPIAVMNTLATISERSASSLTQSPGALAKDLHLNFTVYMYKYNKHQANTPPTGSIWMCDSWLAGQCRSPHETSLVQAWPRFEKRHWRRGRRNIAAGPAASVMGADPSLPRSTLVHRILP